MEATRDRCFEMIALFSQLVSHPTEMNTQERRAIVLAMKPCERMFAMPHRYELLRLTDPVSTLQAEGAMRTAMEKRMLQTTRYLPMKMTVELWTR